MTTLTNHDLTEAVRAIRAGELPWPYRLAEWITTRDAVSGVE